MKKHELIAIITSKAREDRLVRAAERLAIAERLIAARLEGEIGYDRDLVTALRVALDIPKPAPEEAGEGGASEG